MIKKKNAKILIKKLLKSITLRKSYKILIL